MSTDTLLDALLKELQPGERLLFVGTKVRKSKTAVAVIALLFVAVALAIFVHNTLLTSVSFALVTAGFAIRIKSLKQRSGPTTLYALTDLRIFEVNEAGIKSLAKHDEIEEIVDRSDFKFEYKVVSFKNGVAPIHIREYPPNYGAAMLISEKTERRIVEREQ